MANKLFYTYVHQSSSEKNNSFVPDKMIYSYWDSLIFDVNHRTIWHHGMPFGNVYPGTLSYGEIFNDYDRNKGYGAYSHAEGYDTYAMGNASHSEGISTRTTGDASHSEGYGSTSSGAYSHSEGHLTVSVGAYSHSEGQNTYSNGNYSHSEGQNTYSFGTHSHVEGISSKAGGNHSHAEGDTTYAKGESSHVEGKSSSTSENASYSHAEGLQTSTANVSSHSEGSFTSAAGHSSHSEGYGTSASLSYSHAEGHNVDVTSQSAHGEGDTNKILQNSDASHIEGMNNVIDNARYAHAEGLNTVVSDGDAAHAEGIHTHAGGLGSHAEGGSNNANEITYAMGNYSHAEGTANSTYAESSHVEGKSNAIKVQAIYSHIEGFSNYTYSSTSHIEGNENRAFDNNSPYVHIEGRDNITYASNTSHIEGHQNSSYADFTHVEGESNIVKAKYSHVEGINNISYGSYSHVEGNGNKSYESATGSHVEGQSNWTKGKNSHVGGINTYATGNDAFAHGNSVASSNDNETSFGIFNKSYVNANSTVFSVGIGTGENNRKNAFDIRKDGNAYIYESPWAWDYVNDTAHSSTSYNILIPQLRQLATVTYVMRNSAGRRNFMPTDSDYNPTYYGAEYFNNYGDANKTPNMAYAVYSHAEGDMTYVHTGADAAHVEGCGTEARNKGEHASGNYNSSIYGETIFSVGWGTSNTDRSNVFEIKNKYTDDGLGFLDNKPLVTSFLNDTGPTYIWKGTYDKYVEAVENTGDKIVDSTLYFVSNGTGAKRNDFVTEDRIKQIEANILKKLEQQLDGAIFNANMRKENGIYSFDNSSSNITYIWQGTKADYDRLSTSQKSYTDTAFIIINK